MVRLRRRTRWLIIATLFLLVVVVAHVINPVDFFPDPKSRVTPENFKQIRMGMSEAEVRAILGEPSEVKKGSFDKLLVWRSGRKDISIEFTADKACAVGYTRLYEKTIWEILIQYAKKGVKWD